MININALTGDDRGRKVIYHREHCKQEEGELSSWNDKYIFVKFKGPNGEACEPDDVSFIDNYNAAQNALGSTDRGENNLYGDNYQ